MDGVFFLVLLGILGVTLLYSYLYGITPTPTSIKVKNLLLQMLPKITNKEIAELGSGWGTLAFTLASRFPSCQVRAYEISPIPYLVSKLFAKWFSFTNLFIKRQDFFQVSLGSVSLVVCYLYPGAMQRLKIKFENELNPDAYVISHTFAIPGWIPVRSERADDLYRTPIYLYQVKFST